MSPRRLQITVGSTCFGRRDAPAPWHSHDAAIKTALDLLAGVRQREPVAFPWDGGAVLEDPRQPVTTPCAVPRPGALVG